MISDFVLLFNVILTYISAIYDDNQGNLISDNKEIFKQYFKRDLKDWNHQLNR